MRDLVPGMTAVQLEAVNLAKDKYPYTYRNARVARDDGRVVGMALSYPASYHGITPEMRDFFPEERLAHLTDFFTSRVENSWYLDALSVQASHRRKGIGEALIAATKATATENGFDALSLIAFADNHNALALYRKTGFKVVKRVTLQKNRTIQHEGGCVLLNCALHTSRNHLAIAPAITLDFILDTLHRLMNKNISGFKPNVHGGFIPTATDGASTAIPPHRQQENLW